MSSVFSRFKLFLSGLLAPGTCPEDRVNELTAVLVESMPEELTHEQRIARLAPVTAGEFAADTCFRMFSGAKSPRHEWSAFDIANMHHVAISNSICSLLGYNPTPSTGITAEAMRRLDESCELQKARLTANAIQAEHLHQVMVLSYQLKDMWRQNKWGHPYDQRWRHVAITDLESDAYRAMLEQMRRER